MLKEIHPIKILLTGATGYIGKRLLPWLEFQIKGQELIQTATFQCKGLLGRLYWYSVLSFPEFLTGDKK